MRAISLDQRRAESRNETAIEAVSRNNGLAAAPGIRSIETSLDKHVDVVSLAHRHLPGMTRRVMGQVGLIVGRTNHPKQTLAQL